MAVNKRKVKDGSFRYTVVMNAKNPLTGKIERKSVGTFTRRKEADAAERKAKIEIEAGTFRFEDDTPGTSSVVTVASACTDWLNTKGMNLRANTIAGYRIALDHHLIPALGDRRVDSLRHVDIQNVVSKWHADYQRSIAERATAREVGDSLPSVEGCGPQTINRALLILRGALDQQMKSGVVTANAALGIEKPSAKTRKEMRQWTGAETTRFLDEALNHHLAPFWYFTLVEGMRRGEALGLRWSDLKWNQDETACYATINRTVVPDQANGGATLVQDGQAKTKKSKRTVLLTGTTVDMLKIVRDRQRFQRERIGASWLAGDAICITTIGTIPNPTSIRKALDGLLEAAGVSPVTTHGLRHMAATRMLREGISPALVAAKLGHSNISTTVDTYGHLVTEDQERANKAVDDAIRRARTANAGS